MRLPLKLNAIEQEHLQELYDAAGLARDELPYTPAFEQLWQGFQDRTFKNAEREQIYGALLRYTRSAGNRPGEAQQVSLSDEQLKQLKALLPRHAKGGKILPYSDEFEAVRQEFQRLAKVDLSEQDFWRAILRTQGAKRRAPVRRKLAAANAVDDDDDAGE